MAISFRCNCGKRYSVADAMAGRQARCRRCGTRLLIPGQWNEELDAQAPAILGPFGFVAFLFSIAAVVSAMLLPWFAVNLIIQIAAILFACVVLLFAGYFGRGFALPILAILLAFAAFLQLLICPDALERLARFRNDLKEARPNHEHKD